jgi:hypothetical protein
MKPLITGVAIAILFSMFLVFQQDHNRFLRQQEDLKHIADDVAASTAGYCNEDEYSEGRFIFNQAEGNKVLEYQLKSLLHLNDSFVPQDRYWKDKVSYKVYFFDDSNTTYPHIFVDADTGYTKAITQPTVVVTVNAGKPRYRLPFMPLEDTIRSGAYEWKERE